MKKRLLFVLAMVLVLGLALSSPAFAGKPPTYWPGGLKLAYTHDVYGHVNLRYPPCTTSVDTYLWYVYDPNGDLLASSNTENPSGQFTPDISGRYKVTVYAIVDGVSVDSLKGTYRYTAP